MKKVTAIVSAVILLLIAAVCFVAESQTALASGFRTSSGNAAAQGSKKLGDMSDPHRPTRAKGYKIFVFNMSNASGYNGIDFRVKSDSLPASTERFRYRLGVCDYR